MVQAWLRPWRGQTPNLLDMFVTVSLLLFLVGASMIVALEDIEPSKMLYDLQVFF